MLGVGEAGGCRSRRRPSTKMRASIFILCHNGQDKKKIPFSSSVRLSLLDRTSFGRVVSPPHSSPQTRAIYSACFFPNPASPRSVLRSSTSHRSTTSSSYQTLHHTKPSRSTVCCGQIRGLERTRCYFSHATKL
jgi:hypothetical protein